MYFGVESSCVHLDPWNIQCLRGEVVTVLVIVSGIVTDIKHGRFKTINKN